MVLDRIQRFFQSRMAGTAPDTVAGDHALRLATAALFVEMTRADFEIKAEERQVVLAAVRRVLELSDDEANELIALADEETEGSVCLFQFTQLVNSGFPPDRKRQVVENLWRIAFADDVVEKHEEYFVRKIARLLHVPHRDFIAAKQAARRAASHSPSGRSSC